MENENTVAQAVQPEAAAPAAAEQPAERAAAPVRERENNGGYNKRRPRVFLPSVRRSAHKKETKRRAFH